MSQFLSNENRVFQMIDKVVDCMMLSILWLFCCLPVVTIGAATTSLYYTVYKNVRNDRGSLFTEYFRFFKENFKQTTIIGVLNTAALLVIAYDLWITLQTINAGNRISGFFVLLLLVTLILLMWGVYLYPYMARFHDSVKTVIKNASMIAFGNLIFSILLVILLAAAVGMVIYFPVSVIIVPSIYQLIKSFVIEKIFRKYMSEEDIEAEREKNRKYVG